MCSFAFFDAFQSVAGRGPAVQQFEVPMHRNLFALALATSMFGANVTASVAQKTSGAVAQPARLAQGESGGAATSGGVASAGAASETPAPPPTAGAPELQPGPPAGEHQAMSLSTDELIAGGVAVTALVVCAIACFSNSSSTTTSTTVHK